MIKITKTDLAEHIYVPWALYVWYMVYPQPRAPKNQMKQLLQPAILWTCYFSNAQLKNCLANLKSKRFDFLSQAYYTFQLFTPNNMSGFLDDPLSSNVLNHVKAVSSTSCQQISSFHNLLSNGSHGRHIEQLASDVHRIQHAGKLC
jgi:hypothetical protein